MIAIEAAVKGTPVPVHFQFAEKHGRQPEFIEPELPEIAPRPSLPTPVARFIGLIR